MIYSSPEFLLAFAIFFALFWAANDRLRLPLLLIASFGFYAYGEPLGLPLLLGVIALAYASGLLMARWPMAKGQIALVSVTTSLAILASFKYLAFIARLIPGLPPAPEVFLPLGLSFFTFESIAYVIDVKRGATAVERSPLRVGLYIALFPHLISGPIMRANQLIPQLKQRIVWRQATFVSGLQLFVEGFAKKVVVADRAGIVADRVFAAPAEMSTTAAWIGALAYTVEIYGDFAGYTDMGRGIARMLGLELPLNFDAPYAASSMTDFWRRWHISLSSWLRDYLYIGLGGNRRGSLRTYANLIVTMLLGGLWHGAGWTFVAWGGYHGVLLAIERRFANLRRLPLWLGIAMTFFLVVNGWVLFRAHSAQIAFEMYRAMYQPRGGGALSTLSSIEIAVFVAGTLTAMAVKRMGPPRIRDLTLGGARRGVAYGVAAGVMLTVLLLSSGERPFIYFKF